MLVLRSSPNNSRRRRTQSKRWRLCGVGIALCLVLSFGGCAAFRPIHGVPVKYLPNEFRTSTRSGKTTIDLSLLRQTPPPEYLLDAGDILGVYIDGVLGERNQAPPVFYPRDEEVPPSFGYPRPVREDGTIALPMMEPLYVRGMSIRQLEDRLRDEYIHRRKIIQPENLVLVMLQKPRNYRVLVIRQEAGNDQTLISAGGTLNLGQSKRGTGKVVNLPAYKNDVLHALAETGGLPGLDAENTIYIIRRRPGAGSPRSPAPYGPPANPPVAPPNPTHNYGYAPADSPIQQVQYEYEQPYDAAYDDSGYYADAYDDSEYADEYYANDQYTDEQAVDPFAWGHTPTAGPTAEYQQPPSAEYVDPAAYPPPTYPQGPVYPQPPVDYAPPAYGPNGQPGHWWSQPELNDGSWTDLDPTAWQMTAAAIDPTIDNQHTIKIPIRLAAGEQVHFSPQDILLQDGDVVFIESRETEIFYTGGLLGGGQYSLPRDYDLDILGALSIAQSQAGNQSRSLGGSSALNQDVTISASRVVILRQFENGDQVPIEIDLYEALRNPHERILIHPGDYILLQYTPLEAVGAFIERNLLEGALFGLATSTLMTGGGGGN